MALGKTTLLFCSALCLFLSCEEPQAPKPDNGILMDSAFAAQQKALHDTTRRPADTSAGMPADFPSLMEGDLLFQNTNNDRARLFKQTTKSKYSNVGVVFISPVNGKFMVVDALDSIHATELSRWIANSEDKHLAVMRLQHSNRILGEGKTKKLRQKVKELKPIPYDPYLSWDNTALYNSEFVWKLYSRVLYIDLCTPVKLKSFDLGSAAMKKQIGDHYPGGVPDTMKAVSPGNIYESQQLELIYER